MSKPTTRASVSPLRRGATRIGALALPIAAAVAAAALATACGGNDDNDTAAQQAALVAQGKDTFRFETFGDEIKWTDTLRMHEVIRSAVDPTTALSWA